jgi:hypothetical protein
MSSLHHDCVPSHPYTKSPYFQPFLPHPIQSPSHKKPLQQKQDQLVSMKKITYTKRITDKMCASGPVVHKRKEKLKNVVIVHQIIETHPSSAPASFSPQATTAHRRLHWVTRAYSAHALAAEPPSFSDRDMVSDSHTAVAANSAGSSFDFGQCSCLRGRDVGFGG